MTDELGAYRQDITDRELPLDVQKQVFKKVSFEDTQGRTSSVLMSQNNKMVPLSEEEQSDMEADKDKIVLRETTKAGVIQESKRAFVNATVYIQTALGGKSKEEGENTRQQMNKNLRIPAKKDLLGGLVVDIVGGLAFGAGARNIYLKLHEAAVGAKLAKGSATVSQQGAAALAGEVVFDQLANDETAQAAIAHLAEFAGISERDAEISRDLANLLLIRNEEDTKSMAFLKQFSGDNALFKVLDKGITATVEAVRLIKKARESSERVKDMLPKVEEIIEEGNVSSTAAAKKFVSETSSASTLNAIKTNPEMMNTIADNILKTSREGKDLIQVAAGRKFTAGGKFVSTEGNPVTLFHAGDLEDAKNSYFQKRKFLHGVTITETPGKLSSKHSFPVYSSLKEEEILDLPEYASLSHVALKDKEEINSEHFNNLFEIFMDNSFFDPSDVLALQRKVLNLTKQELADIVQNQGLSPEGYNLELVRHTFAVQNLMGLGGFKAISYISKEKLSSLLLKNPSHDMQSIFSKNTKQKTDVFVLRDVDGDIPLTSSESSFAEELLALSKQTEEEIGINFFTPNMSVTDDFNFKNIETFENFEKLISTVSEQAATVISEAKRESITNKLTKQLSIELDWDVKSILKRKKAGTFNAEQMLASRRILVASAQQLDNLSGKISKDIGSKQDEIDFINQMRLHTLIQAQVKGAQTEMGRALQAMSIKVTGEGKHSVDLDAEDILQGVANVKDLANNYSKAQTFAQKNIFAKQALRQKWDTYLFVLSNSLLSNPLTQVKNLVGNVAVQLYTIPESLVMQSIATGRRTITGETDGSRFSDAAAAIGAFPSAFMEGLQLGAKSWKTGIPADKFNKSSASLQRQAFSATRFNMDAESFWGRAVDAAGKIIGAPGRALLSQDDMFKGFTYRMHQQIASRRQMIKEIADGMDEIDVANNYHKAINGENSTISARAAEKAHEFTFTEDLTGALKTLQDARYKYPIIHINIPFLRTPVNLVKYALKRTPIAVLSPSIRKDLISGGPAADAAMARIGLGTAVTWGVYDLATQGHVTGSGSGSWDLDKHMQSTGRQANSFVFKKESLSEETMSLLELSGVSFSHNENEIFVSYKGLEPISTMIGLAADVNDFVKFYHGDDNESVLEVVSLASLHAVRSLSNNTFMRNIHDLTKITQDPNGFLSAYLGNIAAMHVPAILGAVESIKDPFVRVPDLSRQASDVEVQIRKLINKTIAKIPGVSEKLPLGLNFWGEARSYKQGTWSDLINPFHVSDGKRQPIDFEIEKLGRPLTMPSNVIDGVQISSRQYTELVTTMNSISFEDATSGISGNIREVMNAVVTENEEYASLNRENKIQILDRIKNSFLNAARATLKAEDNTLVEAISELKINKEKEDEK